jgi:ABC-2 type transport system ATP-binding protein
MKALVGLAAPEGSLQVLGLDPVPPARALLEQACYIPDVAILPRWARVSELITLMSGLHPRFSAERARSCCAAPAWA